ncbi:hypothetical protein VOLCADRAFT_95888 [Volvox carteri f. nagariensis]|uniref:Haem-binding uptake Tiki superfamily ChaN domain-containing protein n=1 Tax=Volvox carteri f. nagariensis TaxID=3068 RepID=D8U8M6_VOLCA|nr:uncharacterized protein VOLCADRAFT_95888 [Volvox carteri f. nagariensis]EFJ43948.1 hypothetical protein VOLCADRAFT_95888 [Volvox carteri f. nagariensis]|eukprot:XP_002954960.1 hypothetical protein VOLCADRAFT_95888 [Volvox carteri f. nagariensis]
MMVIGDIANHASRVIAIAIPVPDAAVSATASAATTNDPEPTNTPQEPRSLAPGPCGGPWRLQNQQPTSPPSPGGAQKARKAHDWTATEAAMTASEAVMEEGSAFAVYDAEGSPCSFDTLLASLDSYDVVLLGEYHDDPVAHHLQLRLLRHVLGLVPYTQQGDSSGSISTSSSCVETSGRDVHSQGRRGSPPSLPQHEQRHQQLPAGGEGLRRPVALSLEMFDRDVQGVMDEYLSGLVTEADLMKDARPWPNYFSDYRPMVLAAKEAGAMVVCANAPRRYVSLVGRHGSRVLSSLPESSRRHLPPLPLRPASDKYIAKIRWTMQRAREPAPEDTARDHDQQEDEERAAPLTGTSPATATTTAAAAAAAAPQSGGGGGGSEAAKSPQSSSAGSPATTAAANDGSNGGGSGKECPHIGLTLRSNFVEAQNLWDAVMADSIVRTLRQLGAAAGSSSSTSNGDDVGAVAAAGGGGTGGAAEVAAGAPGRRPLVVHICGKFHSEQRLGICEHLAVAGPAAAVCVITFVPSGRGVTVPSATLTTAGLHTYGDWLVLTDGKLPRSFDSDHPV